MNRLERNIDLMNDWHRLIRNLRSRQPLHGHEIKLLSRVASALGPGDDGMQAFIAIENLNSNEPCFSAEVSRWFLRMLDREKGELFPSKQQIDNYKRNYGQFLCTQLVKMSEWQEFFEPQDSAGDDVPTDYALRRFDIDLFFREMCSTMEILTPPVNIVRFEQKFITPMKELYRS